MKITCQSCQSKYTVSDEKVQGKTVKIKCRKCGATILVSSTGVTTTNGAGADASVAEAAPAAAAGSYLVNVAEGDQRTMTLQEVVDAYNSSVVTQETYIWADGMSDWQPLNQVESITSALTPRAAAAPEPAAAPRVAARRDPAKRSQDLFGAGGEAQTAATDDVGTGSPLFRSSGPAAAKPKAGGEENSMLFSLSALTAKAAPSGDGGGGAKALNNEDSGIIDLKALTAAAESRTKAKDTGPTSGLSGFGGMGGMMPDDGGLFLAPPVLTAPIAGPAIAAPIEMPKPNRTPIFIAVGGVTALALIVGVFMVLKGGPEQPPAPVVEATQQVAPPPVPTPSVAATPTAEVSAAPSASAVASGPKGGKPTSGGGTSKAGGATTKAGGATTAPAGGAATTAAAPTKKPGTCNCPPGDLMCAMKCSTN